MDIGIGTYTSKGFDETVSAVRAGLDARGLRVASEFDVSAVLREGGSVDDRRVMSLAVYTPEFVAGAYDVSKDVALMVPVNVVVRESAEGCLVEALNPDLLTTQVAGGLQPLVEGLRDRLRELMQELSD